MSISYYLFSFSLCLFLLHACNGRPLGAIDNKNLEKKFHISNNKNDDKVPVLPKANELGARKLMKDMKMEASSGINAVKTESLDVPVSWRLPRNKRGEKHPGFNSDYLPPKTHPPSHN